MPVRYPPDNQYPQTSNRDPRKPRVVSYVESGPGFFRRLIRRLFSASVIIPVVFISAIVLGVLIYYWTVFSGRIDNLLHRRDASLGGCADDLTSRRDRVLETRWLRREESTGRYRARSVRSERDDARY